MTTATRRRRKTDAEKQAERAEALQRATQGNSLTNLPTVYREFMDRGIPEAEIIPRVNVLTYRAWQAKGRQVRKGEKGVKVITYAPVTRKNDDTGEKETVGKRPWSATVFHVSQTDPIAE
jgi:hypothetical protein